MRLTTVPTARRPRVLLIVADVSPQAASAIAGSLVAIGQVVDVHVVTHAYNRIALAALTTGMDPAPVAVSFIDATAGMSRWMKRSWGPRATRAMNAIAAPLAHARFEEILWSRMRDRLANGEFDVVHRLTPATSAVPSPIAPRLKKLGVPFVLGPLAAPIYWPAGSDAATPLDHPWLAGLRQLYRLLPDYRSTLAATSAILIHSHRAGRLLPRAFRQRGRLMPSPAVDSSAMPVASRRPSSGKGPLRLLFTGELTRANGVDLLLETVAPLINAGKVTLDLVGDGALAGLLHHTIVRDGLGDGARLHLEDRDMAYWHNRSDLLVLPGLRVTDATPVLHAMAAGLPAAVTGHGDMGDIVTSDCGFVLPVASRAEMVIDLRDLLSRLATEPAHIESRSARARWRAHAHFGTDAAVTAIAGIYRAFITEEPVAIRLAA
jgi:glycosyltransferase involved in cell wall biosynthesis